MDPAPKSNLPASRTGGDRLLAATLAVALAAGCGRGEPARRDAALPPSSGERPGLAAAPDPGAGVVDARGFPGDAAAAAEVPAESAPPEASPIVPHPEPPAPVDPGYVYPWMGDRVPARRLVDAVAPPPGYDRVPLEPGSWGDWLRFLPLRPDGWPVHLYDGREKPATGVDAAVIDLDVGDRDLQQCADSIMRLRAEYLWAAGHPRNIAFPLTDGTVLRWTDWSRGIRYLSRDGAWGLHRGAGPDDSRQAFARYLAKVFGFAGTASMERWLPPGTDPARPSPGEMLLQGGHPGHVLLVVDAAQNPSGDRLLLLAQGYMPAQEMHLLHNPTSRRLSPWYRAADLATGLHNPVWHPFTTAHVRRFPEE